MKKLTLKAALIFTLIGSMSGYAQDNVEGFKFVPKSSKDYSFMKDSANMAIAFIKEGSTSLNEAGKSLSSKVIDKLKNVIFGEVANKVGEEHCAERGAFVNDLFPDIVNVCPVTRSILKDYSIYEAKEKFAQLLIHEGTHLTHILDECIATELEIRVMNSTKTGVKQWSNVDLYSNQCDFSWIE